VVVQVFGLAGLATAAGELAEVVGGVASQPG
jgi:hypothetical protein